MIHYKDRWAVVTGASSGLGRGLAARLADRGMSLFLTGRNEPRLNQVAHDIRRAVPQVEVEIVAADLATSSGVSVLLEHIGNRPIEVLVNNAGFGSTISVIEVSRRMLLSAKSLFGRRMSGKR